MKIKQSENKRKRKTDKYWNLAREQETWDIRVVVVIPNVVAPLGTFLKGLETKLEELEIKGKIETI